ncbi:TPA: type 1 fimbrial protein [Salmonella enterica]|nr:type 1 fimbrial protein [Salmonella enterica]HAR9009561.1 type 1 fimbrial protein [Salmonella enterica]HAR9319064.1 type 1 fimbrial protein [Salmonella enterica]
MMATQCAYAVDTVSLNITGNVIAAPCMVNGVAGNIDVDLGNIQATTLSAASSSSPEVPFDIKLTNCPTGTSSVLATFSGTSDPVAGTNYYINTGTATNVAVALIQASTGNLKGNGMTINQTVQPDRTVTISMKAKAYSSAGGAMPGTIKSVVTATFTYQ